MTDPITAAAAFLILATEPAQVPRPITPIMPICCVPGFEPDCQLTMSMSPAPVQGSHHVRPDPGGGCAKGCGHQHGLNPQPLPPGKHNHLSIRWVGDRQYYDHHHRRRHHHEHFDDQP